MPAGQFSSQNLAVFLQWIGEKHHAKRNTVEGWKTATQRVLTVLDESEKEDLRSLDVEQALRRFENKAAHQYSSESLRVYKSRFTSTLQNFLSWAANPASFKMSGAPRTVAGVSATKSGRKVKLVTFGDGAKQAPGAVGDRGNMSSHPASEAFVLPIPLRPGVMVKVFGIPPDLTSSEARKISAVITAYAQQGEEPQRE